MYSEEVVVGSQLVCHCVILCAKDISDGIETVLTNRREKEVVDIDEDTIEGIVARPGERTSIVRVSGKSN
jgi:hypothetical protein